MHVTARKALEELADAAISANADEVTEAIPAQVDIALLRNPFVSTMWFTLW